MKALSIRSPWWFFILHGGKDIENRDWHTRFRGPVLIHVGKWFKADDVKADFFDARLIATKCGVQLPPVSLTQLREPGGCIVGQVTITDCVDRSSSPWFFGEYGFVLADPVAFERPIPCKGALGFFDVPDDLVAIEGDARDA